MSNINLAGSQENNNSGSGETEKEDELTEKCQDLEDQKSSSPEKTALSTTTSNNQLDKESLQLKVEQIHEAHMNNPGSDSEDDDHIEDEHGRKIYLKLALPDSITLDDIEGWQVSLLGSGRNPRRNQMKMPGDRSIASGPLVGQYMISMPGNQNMVQMGQHSNQNSPNLNNQGIHIGGHMKYQNNRGLIMSQGAHLHNNRNQSPAGIQNHGQRVRQTSESSSYSNYAGVQRWDQPHMGYVNNQYQYDQFRNQGLPPGKMPTSPLINPSQQNFLNDTTHSNTNHSSTSGISINNPVSNSASNSGTGVNTPTAGSWQNQPNNLNQLSNNMNYISTPTIQIGQQGNNNTPSININSGQGNQNQGQTQYINISQINPNAIQQQQRTRNLSSSQNLGGITIGTAESPAILNTNTGQIGINANASLSGTGYMSDAGPYSGPSSLQNSHPLGGIVPGTSPDISALNREVTKVGSYTGITNNGPISNMLSPNIISGMSMQGNVPILNATNPINLNTNQQGNQNQQQQTQININQNNNLPKIKPLQTLQIARLQLLQ
jgi:hypothetical protein